MSYRIVSYRAKAEKADENQRLIGDVFRELQQTQPSGLRYAVLRLEDDSFIHLLWTGDESASLTSLPSFQAFVDRVEDRQVAPAVHRAVSVVGNYGVLNGVLK